MPRLGELMAPMLGSLSDRGPDSAGFAVYGDAALGGVKMTLQTIDGEADFEALAAELAEAGEIEVEATVRGSHCVILLPEEAVEPAAAWIAERGNGVRVASLGRRMEIYKDVGRPETVVERFELAAMRGTHAIGHTRMATESAVTTQGAHPYSTGFDQCLVHNGSLSNHNTLRRRLVRDGFTFDTENDTEVAAAYLSWRMRQGMNLGQALESSLADLDGFYTFVVGTESGFGVLRDPIACKPAVMAETDAYVAFGSEYRALTGLPDIGRARVWEPDPAKVYFWERGQ